MVFKPTVVGAVSDTLTVKSGTTTLATFTVTGTGLSLFDSSPASLTFEAQKTGTTSQPKPVTMTNTGTVERDITAITVEGPFDIRTKPPLPHTVAGGNGTSDPISVVFKPTAGVPPTGTLIIATTEPSISGSSATVRVPLSGAQVEFATEVSPTSLTSFGDQRMGTTSSTAKTVTVFNRGESSLSVRASTSDETQFVLDNPPTMPFTVAAGASQVLSVKFHPTGEGNVTGNLVLTSNEVVNPASDPPQTFSTSISLSGRGVKPHVVLSSSLLDFQDQRVGTTVTQTVQVSNTGDEPIIITNIAESVDSSAAFTIVDPPSVPVTLSKGGLPVELEVEFTPDTETSTAVTGSIVLTTEDSDPALQSFSVGLSGRGVRPHVVLNPTALDFKDQRVRTTATKTVLVSNTGDEPITITNIATSVDSSASFTLVDHPGVPVTLSKGGLPVELEVEFTPDAETSTAVTGSIVLTTEDSDPALQSFSVGLSGRGVRPHVVLNPTALDFKDQRVRTTIEKTVLVSNTGEEPITITGIAKGAGSSLDFTLVSPTSGSFRLVKGEPALELKVAFTPDIETTTAVTGSIVLTTGDSDPALRTFSVGLSGKGVKPNLVLSPASWDFEEQRVGTTVTKKVQVSNTGSGPIVIASIARSLGSSPYFKLVSPPSGEITLAKGDPALELTVEFTPLMETTTAVTGSIVLTTKDWEFGTFSVNLSGKGVEPHIVVEPTPLDFQDQRVRTTVTKTLTVRNTGSGPITITGLGRSGSSAFALVSPPSVPIKLAGGGTAALELKVSFSPTTEPSTPETGAITFTTEDPDPALKNFSVNLSGKGVKPTIVVEPKPLDFQDQRVGTERTLPVTVRNTGSGSIVISGISMSGSSAFTLVTPPSTPFTLPAGGSQGLSVKFSPSSLTSETGVITFTAEDLELKTFSVSVFGRGVKPSIVLGPNPLAFGKQRVGTDRTLPVTVRNTGSGPIRISSISTGTGAIFTLVSPPSTPLTLEPGPTAAALELSVKFSPAAEATYSGAIAFTTEDPDPALKNFSVDLSGQGVMPSIALDPLAIAFGAQRVGSENTKMVTVSNTGSGPIVISDISKSGSSDFTIVSAPSTPFTLAAEGAPIVLSVKFSPTADASVTGALTFTTADPELKSFSVDLSGRGQKPSIVLDPIALDFGEQRVGTESTKSVAVRNTGSLPLVVSSLSIGSGQPFVVSPSTGFTIQSGESQVLSVTFKPTSEAAVTGAALTLSTDDPNRLSATVPLLGSGVKPTLTLSPISLDFEQQRVNTTSAPQTVRVSNTGTGTLRVTSLSVTGPFLLSSPAFDVPSGRYVELSVRFSPSELGAATGTLTLTTNDPGANSSVTLSGTGVRPKLELRPDSLAFGPQRVGFPSTSQRVLVHNSGTGPVHVGGISITAGKPFTVSPSGSFNLLAGESKPLDVTFSPTTKTPETATLSLTTDEATPSANSVALSGTGVTNWEMDPADVSFGPVARNTFVTRTIKLTNTSGAPIRITEVSSLAAPFSIEGLSSPLPEIGAYSAIDFKVKFSPTSAGTFNQFLRLTSDAHNSSLSLPLSGTGTVPEVQLSLPGGAVAASLDFRGVQLNTEKTLLVTITNTGGAEYISEKPTLTSSSSAFTYKGPDSIRLLPGAYMELPISFRPTSDIPYNDTLTINSNIVGGQTTLGLTGFGANPKVEHSPSSIFFGDVRVGSASDKNAITVKNTGNASVMLGPLPVVGPFEVVLPSSVTSLPVEVPAKTNFTFEVRFKPTAEGGATGSVTIRSDISGDSTRVVELSGTGIVSTLKTFVPEIDFGNRRVGSTSDIRSLSVKNEGTAELEITKFTNPSVFSVSPPSGSLPLRIRAGETVPLYVTFTPDALGPVEGLLEITSNAATQSPPVNLKGRGIDGRLTVTPAGPVNLGATDVGGPGTHQTVTLTNAGEARLTIVSVTPPADSPFVVSGLLPGTPVDPGEGVSFTVSFKPGVRGNFSASASIETDSVLNHVFTLLMQGTGKAAAVQLEPGEEVNFGKANVRESIAQTLSIKNVGENPLHVSNISFAEDASGSPGSALDFSVDSSVKFPLEVAAGGSVPVRLQFTPSAVDLRQARAIVYTNDRAAEVKVLGFGTSPNLDLSPGILNFGNVVVGNSSEPSTITFKNKGNGPLTLSELTLGGTDKAAFTLTTPTLPITLMPSASTEVSVTFTPDGERPSFSAQLLVKSSDPVAPSRTVSMSGSGVLQQIQLSESLLEFGNQLIKHTSLPRELRVTNDSNTNVTLTALTIEGEGASQFTRTTLSLPFILGPGRDQQLKLGVSFAPLSETDVNCTLKLTFSELPQPLEVKLHGKGIPAVFSISPSPLDFGGVRAGSSKREQRITLSNLSSDRIVLTAPEVEYTTGEPFMFDGASLHERPLDPGMSVIVTVGYQPMVETLSETTLSFGTTTPSQPLAVGLLLKGKAVNRLLSVDQESLDFGWAKVNSSVEPKVVTITNRSAQQQRVVVMLRDLEDSPFALEAKALANPIPAGGTATFTVAFDPDKAGEASNEVQVWLQGDTSPEVLISTKGIGRALTGSGGGCSCGTTEAGSAGMLMLLALVGLGSRRRKRE
ncbi:hypothetical protein BO221_25620 [Archangium sp. Cb G35]|nr:hypothetical protein BO221_25620 [Archangium sp. Cb G35]